MTKFKDLSLIKRIGIISLLLLVLFMLGGAIGYLSGLDGDSASTTQKTRLIIDTKIGFLWMSLPIVGFILGSIGDFLEEIFKLNLPSFLGNALLFGCIFAVFNGNSILLKIEIGDFWLQVLDGFLMGSIIGAISGIWTEKTDKVKLNDDSAIEDSAL